MSDDIVLPRFDEDIHDDPEHYCEEVMYFCRSMGFFPDDFDINDYDGPADFCDAIVENAAEYSDTPIKSPYRNL